jgi:hypothetical protein
MLMREHKENGLLRKSEKHWKDLDLLLNSVNVSSYYWNDQKMSL